MRLLTESNGAAHGVRPHRTNPLQLVKHGGGLGDTAEAPNDQVPLGSDKRSSGYPHGTAYSRSSLSTDCQGLAFTERDRP